MAHGLEEGTLFLGPLLLTHRGLGQAEALRAWRVFADGSIQFYVLLSTLLNSPHFRHTVV